MPLSTRIETYPPQFHRLAARFESETSPFSYGFAAAGPAHALRLRLYGFKKAILRQNALNTKAGLFDPHLYPSFLATEIVIRKLEGIHYVIIRMPESSDEIAGLDLALDRELEDFKPPGTPKGRSPLNLVPEAIDHDAAEEMLENLYSIKGKPLEKNLCSRCSIPLSLPNPTCSEPHSSDLG